MRKLVVTFGALGMSCGLITLAMFWCWYDTPRRINFGFVGEPAPIIVRQADATALMIAMPISGLVAGMIIGALVAAGGWKLLR